eukprot:scaffold116512_cov87-Phaeocystis_antarctica.AAC.3
MMPSGALEGLFFLRRDRLGTCGQEQLDNLRVPERLRPRKRPCLPPVGGVDVRAGIEQHPDHLLVSLSRRHQQRRRAVVRLHFGGRVGGEQMGDDAGVAHLGSHVERRLREATCERVDGGALPEEQLGDARAAAVRGEVERRRAVRAEGVHGRIVL